MRQAIAHSKPYRPEPVCGTPVAPFPERFPMPDKNTLDRVRADKRARKSASTQAGEFVREEIEHIREGKHGARSAKQAIAIGLSKARRAGVDLPPPKPGTTSEENRKRSTRDYAVGHGAAKRPPSPARSKASREALEKRVLRLDRIWRFRGRQEQRRRKGLPQNGARPRKRLRGRERRIGRDSYLQRPRLKR